MKMIKLLAFAFVSLITSVCAEFPAKIAGSWILDETATKSLMKTSPLWDTEGTKYLPILINSMAMAQYTFAEDSITISMPDEVRVIKSKLVKREGNTYTFQMQESGRTSMMTVTLNEKGQLNMRTLSPAITDYSLWKRGVAKASKEPVLGGAVNGGE